MISISIHSPHARGDGCTDRTVRRCLISIHSPHARGDHLQAFPCFDCVISIHSPHARGDLKDAGRGGKLAYFNPLPSCEGRRWPNLTGSRTTAFQSTPLMRGETRPRRLVVRRERYFNPLPSCEGRPCGQTSIIAASPVFQSTPLMRGETHFAAGLSAGYAHFNPLPSCEGRRC